MELRHRSGEIVSDAIHRLNLGFRVHFVRVRRLIVLSLADRGVCAVFDVFHINRATP